MTRLVWRASARCGIMLLLLSVSASAQNRLVNGSLETGSGAYPDSWNVFAGDTATIGWLSSGGIGDSRCIEETAYYANLDPTNWVDLRSDPFDVTGLTAVVWEFAYRFSTNPAGALTGTTYVELRFFDAGWIYVGEDAVRFDFSGGNTNMGGWLTIPQRMFSVPSGGVNCDVRCSGNIFIEFSGTFRVDDFLVEGTTTVSGSSLVPNASFESGSGRYPLDWFYGEVGDAYLMWTNVDAFSGNHCVQLGVEHSGNGTNAEVRSLGFSLGTVTEQQLQWWFSYKFLENDAAGLSGTPVAYLRFFQDAGLTHLLTWDTIVFSNVLSMTNWATTVPRIADIPDEGFYADVQISVDTFEPFAGAFRIDDVIVQAVPEPGVSAITALLLVSACIWERRMKPVCHD